MDWGFVWYVGGTASAVIGGAWSLAWWFARQFSNIKAVIYEVKDQIISKLEYHERHDDQRFQAVDEKFHSVRNDIWEIRVRNAAIDGRANLRKDKEIIDAD